MNAHNLRGQIIATLLSVVGLYGSGRRELRSRKRKRRDDTVVVSSNPPIDSEVLKCSKESSRSEETTIASHHFPTKATDCVKQDMERVRAFDN